MAVLPIFLDLPSARGETVTSGSLTIAAYDDPGEPLELSAFGGRGQYVNGQIVTLSAGRAVPLDDGTTYLDFTGVLSAQTVTGSTDTGQPVTVYVAKSQQDHGMPNGEHPWLPLNENDRFVCEPGERHRTWFIAASTATGMTKAEVAAHASVSESAVTGQWLFDRPIYGSTEAMAVTLEVFHLYLDHVRGTGKEPRSDHWLFERGGDYTAIWDNPFMGIAGEDELHPLRYGAWGTGARPILGGSGNDITAPFSVVEDARFLHGDKTWFTFSRLYDRSEFGGESYLGFCDGVTVREFVATKSWRDAPNSVTADGKWAQHPTRISAFYLAGSERVRIVAGQADHAGWADGYDYNMSATMPDPVEMFSHNIYASTNNLHTCIDDSAITRASSCGLQLRSGVRVRGNLLADSNILAAMTSQSGEGQFSLITDNVGISAALRTVSNGSQGGTGMAFDAKGPQTTLKDNIVAHSANPDDPAEIDAKQPLDFYDGVEKTYVIVDDTQMYRWNTTGNVMSRNVDGLDPAVLDLRTAQRYFDPLIGVSQPNWDQIRDYISASASIGATVRGFVDWMKAGFGKPRSSRTAPADLIFTPDADLDGVLWDNRFNWSTKDLPGRNAADTVDLAGHKTKFSNFNASIAAMTSNSGLLDAVSGKLEVGTLLDAADVKVRYWGQLYVGSAAHPLSVKASAGRLALTGTTASLDLDARGAFQALLGPDATATNLIIRGQRPKVGWDAGPGSTTLTIDRLEFTRGVSLVVESSGIGGPDGKNRARYLYKGVGMEIVGKTSGFRGRVAAVNKWNTRGTQCQVWLDTVVGTPVVGEIFDILPGRAGELLPWEPQSVSILSILSQGLSPLRRFRSGSIGTGLVEPDINATVHIGQLVVPAGLPSGSTHDLLGAGVTLGDIGALPAGVALVNGKPVFTA